ncbi:Meiosis protein mei2 [Cladobotryum mycophilum]|uniref:Meiosis protein mei2 n=1 Tax=Cladobotryum mycophilum TaxID=491253 RepID=A0ABR0S9S8_9HYPO
MAQIRENPSSPRSSTGGADSFKGTPDTRLTAFSPEDGSAKSSKLLKGFTRSASVTPPVRLPVTSLRSAISPLDKDPFVTSVQEVDTRLSPTASAFNPFANELTHRLSAGDDPIARALSTDLGLFRSIIVSSTDPVSVSDVDGWLAGLESKGDCLHGARYTTTLDGVVSVHFTDIRDACSVHSSIRLTEKSWNVAFANVDQVAQMPRTPRGTTTDHQHFNYRSDQEDLSDHAAKTTPTGQILLFAVVPPGSVVDPVRAMEAVRRFLQSHGRLFALVKRATFQNGSFRAVAEFCDITAATPAIESCNRGLTTEGIQLFATSYHPDSVSAYDLAEAFEGISVSKMPAELAQQHEPSGPTATRPGPADIRVHAPFAMYPFMFHSPYTPSMSYMLDSFVPIGQANPANPMTTFPPTYPVYGSLYQTPPSPALTAQNNYSPSRQLPGTARADARRQNAMRVNRSSYHNIATHHNHVDINRIRDGIDVRTTIMLRNIPNKVDQAMLKRIVDESSWGKYDFMYLRIDFANDCNVGYAFINFVDPLDIIDFVNARGNQRWNCFKSDKVAEISYATIQGKDCLVQKFRNSSVMLEAPHYRPKLYFTSNGPMPELAGQEEPFPPPDNQSKMKRSCENAEHVGLFTPNAGQHFRDEQRRRRSQYDRGTRLAALEEYDYEAAIQHLYSTTAQ